MTRLQHLSDILGMNQFEVATVHQDLSEQAFKAQVGVFMIVCCVLECECVYKWGRDSTVPQDEGSS